MGRCKVLVNAMFGLKYLTNVSTLKLNQERCVGCQECIRVCPHAVFEPEGKKVHISAHDRCMECGACARNCPAEALSVVAGVGCAAAIIIGALRGTEPNCDCGSDSGCC